MRRRGLLVLWALAAVSCRHHPPASTAPAADAGGARVSDDKAATLFGAERGLDHVGVAVQDLDVATRSYHDLLGFSRPVEGKLPNGIRNVNYYFADATYLETMVAWDASKAAWLAEFTAKRSGGVFAALSVQSYDATAQFLAVRGFKVGAPFSGTIQTAGESAPPEEKWRTFFLPQGTLPDNPFFFIAYARGPRDDFLHKLENHAARRLLYHENTALGIRSVWVAVQDLEAASEAYESIGLSRARAFKDDALGAKGQAFAAGQGEIWLLGPSSADGEVASFLRERGGSAVLGMTLLAGSVLEAAKLISSRTGEPMPTYAGQLGTSIRVPPRLAHGVWLEFSQYIVQGGHT